MVQSRREFLIRAVHVFTLVGFALAQPLFDLISQYPEFFVAHQSQPFDVFLLTLCLSVLIPLVIVLVVLPIAAATNGRITLGLSTGLLVTLVSLTILRGVDIPSPITLSLSAGVGMLFGVAYVRYQSTGTFLTILSPAIVLFPSMFLYSVPLEKLRTSQGSPSDSALSIERPAPVVMMVFDELPTISLLDEQNLIDPVRFPNLRSLADESHWFRMNHTVSDGTLISLPAILDGLYPTPENPRLPIRSDHPRNLFTLLAEEYRLKVFENLTRLSPLPQGETEGGTGFTTLVDDCSLLYLHLVVPIRLAREHLPSVTESWGNFRGESSAPSAESENPGWKDFQPDWSDRHLQFRRFVDSIEPDRTPTLYFLHSMLPHASWKYLPSGRFYALRERPGVLGVIGPNNEGIDVNQWTEDEWLTVQGYQRHLLQVGFVDRLIGELVARLRQIDLYDESMIIITADHGTGFTPGDSRRNVTASNHPEIMMVPLILKLPQQKKGVLSDRNVATIDILPTIIDVLGINHSWTLDGHSALDPEDTGSREKIIFADQGTRQSFDADVPKIAEFLQRKISLFGTGDWDRIFRIGSYRQIVGKSPSEMPDAGESRLKIEMDGEVFFQNVDPAAPFLLSQIAGRVVDAPGTDLPDIAIAVNGVIRAVTRATALPEGVRFSAVVPESSFRRGKNDVDVYEIQGPGSHPSLKRVRRETQRVVELVLESEEESLRFAEGHQVPVVSDGVTGWVVSSLTDDRVSIAGWAADLKTGTLTEAVLLFLDGEFLGTVETSSPRTDVVASFDLEGIENSGFYFEMPLTDPDTLKSRRLRIFAVSSRGVAGELHSPPAERSEQWHFLTNPNIPLDSVTRDRFREARAKQSADDGG